MNWVLSIALTALLLLLTVLSPRVRRFLASDGVGLLLQLGVVIVAALNFDGDAWGVVLGATVVLLFLRLAGSPLGKRLVLRMIVRHVDRNAELPVDNPLGLDPSPLLPRRVGK